MGHPAGKVMHFLKAVKLDISITDGVQDDIITS